jgi:AsmA protein
MRKIGLWLAVLLGLPLLVLIAGVVFVATLDPNRLKPIIIDAALQQGITANLAGDLSWRFYPNLALEVRGLDLTNTATQQMLASVQVAGLSVALKPLLKRQIEVNGIEVEGIQLNYWLDAEEQSNWPKPEASKTLPAATPASNPTKLPELNISSLTVSDLAVDYRDASGAAVVISGLNLSAQEVNLQGRHFPLRIDGQIKYADLPLLTLDSKGVLAVNLDKQQAKLENLVIELLLGSQKSSEAQGNLEGTFSTDVSWAEPLTATTTVALATANLRTLLSQLGVVLPTTQNANAFKTFTLNSRLLLAGNSLVLEDTVVKMDRTTLRAKASVKNFDTPKIIGSVAIDTIAVDSYLPPSSPQDPQEAAASAPTPLPLDEIRKLDLAVDLSLDEVLMNAISAKSIKAKLVARDGQVILKPFDLKVANGQIGMQLSFDARQPVAQLNGVLTTEGISLDMLLVQLKQDAFVAGALNSQVKFTSKGKTDQDLINNMVAEIEADSAQIKLNEINIEKHFCDAVNLLTGTVANDYVWPTYSELSPLKLQATYANNKVQLKSLNADIQKLQASSYGEIDLNTGEFRFPLDVRLADFATGLEGCLLVDEKWRNRDVPLRCKGNLANIGAKTCLPDGPRITEKIKNKAKQELAQEVDKAKEKIVDKAQKETDRFLEKHTKDEDVQKIKDNLKDLLKR